VRPNVVLFGEMLPFDKVERLHTELAEGFDVIIAVGTSALFPYISEPIYEAEQTDTLTVEINPGVTELTDAFDLAIAMGASEALEAIWKQCGFDLAH
jgi:NAD-dependent deacetylase